METKKRIYWSETEREKILDRAADLIRKNPLASISEIIDKAQSVIAKDRRRAYVTAPWIELGLRERLVKDKDTVAKLEDRITRLEVELEQAKEELSENPTKEELIEEALDTMDSTEMLVRFIRKHGEERNAILYELERMNSFVFNNLAKILTANGKTVLVPPERKKLVFVGFKQHIGDAIKMDFDKYAELTFVASSMPLGNYPNKCDCIFISQRDTSENLRQRMYDSKYSSVCSAVNGGIVKLRQAVWAHLNDREVP